jgi:hypothetical protein
LSLIRPDLFLVGRRYFTTNPDHFVSLTDVNGNSRVHLANRCDDLNAIWDDLRFAPGRFADFPIHPDAVQVHLATHRSHLKGSRVDFAGSRLRFGTSREENGTFRVHFASGRLDFGMRRGEK